MAAVEGLLRQSELLQLAADNEHAGYTELAHTYPGEILSAESYSQTILSGCTLKLFKYKDSAAAYLTTGKAEVLFTYNDFSIGSLPQSWRKPALCIMSGAVPKDIDKLKAGGYFLSAKLCEKQGKQLYGRKIVLPEGDKPVMIVLRGQNIEVRGGTVDIYR